MKKFLTYSGAFVLLFFIFPAICTISPKEDVAETVSNVEENDNISQPEQNDSTQNYAD